MSALQGILSSTVAPSTLGIPGFSTGSFDFSPIPEELRALSIWVLWKLESRGDKTTKVPFQRNGRNASSTDSGTWCSFDEAVTTFEANPTIFSGIGAVIVPPYVGVDFDNCRNPKTGEVTKFAADCIAALASYTEVSVSGRGFHVWCKGSLPASIKTPEIEIYVGNRYFTFTAQHVAGTAETINDVDLVVFRDTFLPDLQQTPKEKLPHPAQDGFDRLSDAIAKKHGGNRWFPFEQRVGGDFLLGRPGTVQPCPFHDNHTSENNFGIMKSNERRIVCLGKTGNGWHGWDAVSSVFEWDHKMDASAGRPPRHKNMFDCARAICEEQGLTCEDYIPQSRGPYLGSQSFAQSVSSPSEIPILQVDEPTYPDMPEEALGDGALAEICLRDMSTFPRAYAFPSLLTVGGTMVPLAAITGDEESLVITARRSNQTNVYTALVGPIHTGKTVAIQYAAAHLKLPLAKYTDTKAGSIEGLLAKLSNDGAGRQMLVDLDEWSQFFKKAGIDNASFIDILNSGFNKTRHNLTIARGEKISLDCAISLIGGIVHDNVQECFGNSSTGGFHDRFLFGICPTKNPFTYEELQVAHSNPLNPCEVSVDRGVWELTRQWNRADASLGRAVEVTIRCAVIIASFDGRKILYAQDVERMKPFLDYQSRCRQLITPNPGTTNDAKMCNAILGWMNQHAPGGEWATMRAMKKGIHRHLETLGAGAFTNALKNLNFMRAIAMGENANPKGAPPSDLVRLVKGA